MDSYLSKQEVVKILRHIDTRLTELNQKSQMYIVGGVAMIMQYDFRDTTEDIDAYYTNKHLVESLANELKDVIYEVGERFLNDDVTPHIIEDAQKILLYDGLGLTVYVASPYVLLMMKMKSHRPKDVNDVENLIRYMQLPHSEKIYSDFLTVYPDQKKNLADVQRFMGDRYNSIARGRVPRRY